MTKTSRILIGTLTFLIALTVFLLTYKPKPAPNPVPNSNAIGKDVGGIVHRKENS